jgi:hypothetical protein
MGSTRRSYPVANIEKFFGRRRPTSHDIAKKLAETGASRAALIARESELLSARKAAVDALDEAALEAADRDLAAVRRKIELQESAISQLQAAQAEAVDTEAREAFLSEVAEHQADANELARRLESDYGPAAAVIGAILEDLRTLASHARELQKRAQELGVSVTLRNPEDVRRLTPTRYSATWPNPEGNGVIQGPARDAPRGCVRWVDGLPTAAREGVTIIAYRPEPLESLLETVGNLPPLHQGEPYFFTQDAGQKAACVANIATARTFGEAVREREIQREARRELVSTFPINLVKALSQ